MRFRPPKMKQLPVQPPLPQTFPALQVKLTDNVLRSFQVSRNFDCSLICCEAAQKVRQGCLSSLPSAADSPPPSGASGSSKGGGRSSSNGSSNREKWKISSGHWSQDGTSIILAVVCCVDSSSSSSSLRTARSSRSDSGDSSSLTSGSSTSSHSTRSSGRGGGVENGHRLGDQTERETATGAAAKQETAGDPVSVSSISSVQAGNSEGARDDPRHAKILLFTVQTGRLAYVHRTGFRHIHAVRYVQGGTRKCLIAVDEPKCAVVLWDLDSNRLERHFPLPAPTVPHSGLDIHPTNDLFLASCLDGTVLLLHLRNSQALGCVRGSPCSPIGAFDCEGLVYACSLGSQEIHLFGCDDDTLGREPAGQFSSFDLSSTLAAASYITSLAFSPDEKTLLVGSNRTQIVAIDAFSGSKLYELRAAQPLSSLSSSQWLHPQAAAAATLTASASAGAGSSVCPVTLSPDSRFVLWGDAAGSIYIWRTNGKNAAAAAAGATEKWQQEQKHETSGGSSSSSAAGREGRGVVGGVGAAEGNSSNSGSKDGSQSGTEENRMLVQKRVCHDASISFLLFSPTHAIFASVAGDILALWQPPPPASMPSPTMRV